MARGEFVDVPMSLGDHLEELRRRLKWPLITLGLVFFVAFAFESRIQHIFVQPLAWATQLVPDYAKKVGLPTDGTVKLTMLGIWEGPMASMKVSFYAAFFIAFPVLVYHLWMFVGVGLMPKERRLAFLFVPAGIMFFYAGTLTGYFIGLPYFYSFMIKWSANSDIANFQLRLSDYHQDFVMMTVMFGLIADIPWLVMVLVRVGFVTVPQLLKHWKIAIFVNTAIAAVVAPPDFFSMVAMMVPLYLLYFLGVGLSALMMRHHSRLEQKEQAAELARMAEEERRAHEAQVPRSSSAVAEPAAPVTNEAPVAAVGDPPAEANSITADLAASDQAPSSDDHSVNHGSTSIGDGTSTSSADDSASDGADDYSPGANDTDDKDDGRG